MLYACLGGLGGLMCLQVPVRVEVGPCPSSASGSGTPSLQVSVGLALQVLLGVGPPPLQVLLGVGPALQVSVGHRREWDPAQPAVRRKVIHKCKVLRALPCG